MIFGNVRLEVACFKTKVTCFISLFIEETTPRKKKAVSIEDNDNDEDEEQIIDDVKSKKGKKGFNNYIQLESGGK